MGVVGFAIYQIQRVEEAISSCWPLYAHTENESDSVFVFDGDYAELCHRNSKKALGRLLADLTAAGQLNSTTEKRFAKFVDNRNRLIHRIFKEKAYSRIRNKRALLRLHRFTSNLFREAYYFETLFDAYLGVCFHLVAEEQGDNFKGRELLNQLMEEKRKSGAIDMLHNAMRKKSTDVRTRRSTTTRHKVARG